MYGTLKLTFLFIPDIYPIALITISHTEKRKGCTPFGVQPHLFVLGLVPNTFILGIAPHIGSLLFLARVHISAARAGAVDRHAGCKQALCGEHHDCEGRADIFFSHSFPNLIVCALFHINLLAVSDVEPLGGFCHAAAAEVVAGGGRNGSGRFNQSFYLRGGAIIEHHAPDI